MAHMKRISMPKTWPLTRKGTTFVVAPLPGRKLEHCLPLGIVLKLLGAAKNSREAKHLLNSEKVKVDGKVCKEHRYPVGLFDILSLGDEHYRLLFKGKKLSFNKIDEKEANVKPCKIIGKKVLKKGVLQFNLHDGRNVLGKEDYKINDTLIVDTKDGSVKGHLRLDKGACVYMLGGKQLGKVGKVSDSEDLKVLVDDKEVPGLKKYIFVIGKDKPIINILEGDLAQK